MPPAAVPRTNWPGRHADAPPACRSASVGLLVGRANAPVAAPAFVAATLDPFHRWRLANAERLTGDALARGYDSDG